MLNVKKNQIKIAQNIVFWAKTSKINFIKFGHDHDYKFGSQMMSSLPTNAVGVMDRGFAGLKFIQELVQENKYFVGASQFGKNKRAKIIRD